MKRAYTDEHARAGISAALPEIETWPNQFPGYEIEIAIPEFTVTSGIDAGGAGKILASVAGADLTFSGMFSVVAATGAIPANNPEALVHYIKWASTQVVNSVASPPSQAVADPAAADSVHVSIVLPPQPTPGLDIDVW